MAKLTELIKNVPKAIGETTKDRAKSLGKSIVRGVHPKNIVAKGFYALHNAAAAELPELGALTGGIGAFASDVYDRASGKRNKRFNQPPMGPTQPVNTSNDNKTNPMISPAILKLLESIGAGIDILTSDSKSIIAELRTLTNITSKVWDVNKKTLAATRQGNEIQVDLERKNKFSAQEAAGDFQGEPDKGSKAEGLPKKAPEPFSFDITENMFKAAEGLLAEAGEVTLAAAGAAAGVSKFRKIMNEGKAPPKIENPEVSRAQSAGFGEAEGAKPGSPLAKKVEAFKASQPIPESPMKAGIKKLGEVPGVKLFSKILGPLTIAMTAFSAGMDAFEAGAESHKQGDSVFLTGAKGWAAAAESVATGITDLITFIPKLIAPDWYKNNVAAPVQKAEEGIGSGLMEAEDSITNLFSSKKSTPLAPAKMQFNPQSKNTQQAASIHSNQQMIDQAQTHSQMMPQKSSQQPIISAPTQTNVNNTSNSFSVNGANARENELEKYIYPQISP